MKKFISFILVILVFSPLFAASKKNDPDLTGTWKLIYSGGMGYEFRFKSKYVAYVVVHAKDYSVVFKGIYSIEEGNLLTIKLSDMKNEANSSKYESNKNFTKIYSSSMNFRIENVTKSILILKTEKVMINGNNSDGYFEPRIELKK